MLEQLVNLHLHLRRRKRLVLFFAPAPYLYGVGVWQEPNAHVAPGRQLDELDVVVDGFGLFDDVQPVLLQPDRQVDDTTIVQVVPQSRLLEEIRRGAKAGKAKRDAEARVSHQFIRLRRLVRVDEQHHQENDGSPEREDGQQVVDTSGLMVVVDRFRDLVAAVGDVCRDDVHVLLVSVRVVEDRTNTIILQLLN